MERNGRTAEVADFSGGTSSFFEVGHLSYVERFVKLLIYIIGRMF
jgi:hypothetical protein